jgi:hypothetical protein
LIEIVANRRAEQRTEWTADHEAEGSTQHFSPHDLLHTSLALPVADDLRGP